MAPWRQKAIKIKTQYIFFRYFHRWIEMGEWLAQFTLFTQVNSSHSLHKQIRPQNRRHWNHHMEYQHIWDLNKMAAFVQTIYWNAFSLMKQYEVRLWFNLSLYLGGYITTIGPIIGSDNRVVPIRWQAIICTIDILLYQCIYATLGPKELRVLSSHSHMSSFESRIINSALSRQSSTISYQILDINKH